MTYSREEKIAYYKRKIATLQKRLERIQSPDYQDWNSNLELQLENKKLRAENEALKSIIKEPGKAPVE